LAKETVWLIFENLHGVIELSVFARPS